MGVRGEWQCLITAHEDASQDGTDRVNEYFMMENLGKGAFAKVKRCERRVENTNPRSFAAKIMSKSALHRMKEYVREGESMRVVTALDKVEAEIEIMRTLYHRNIVLLFEVINDPASDKIYLILEYMSKGPCMVYTPASKTFHSPITGGPLTEELAKEHVRGIVQGVKYLHSRGVCHRDIKPDNILLNADNRCHLSDFGCAQCFLPTDRITNTLGTFQFFAPECCSGDPFDPFLVDAWAIGVTLFTFLFGVLPFDAPTPKDLFDSLLENPVQMPSSTSFSSLCLNFLQLSLQKDPSQRMTVLSMELHPWLAVVEDDDEPPSF
ncbi:CAMKK protein kinase [Aphanomyces invadans]|uniref:CAMKK protein kinase n=1 Tax=Aphanomyces invadans TaxID=157072 RepID=A0A024UNT0_9STRA|nr:CAMKK protein kinase [Aphanomyces invadans]ETW07497.1 CAMKK protein kinase [Aphanomyces invadans]|eukprot:XP_008863590.1 CAMKK protein kinase [Aphanomyces invadans]